MATDVDETVLTMSAAGLSRTALAPGAHSEAVTDAAARYTAAA